MVNNDNFFAFYVTCQYFNCIIVNIKRD